MKNVCKFVGAFVIGAIAGYILKTPCIAEEKQHIVENPYIEVSKTEASVIIADPTKSPRGKFWLYEDGGYVGIDNHTHDAWTEEFNTKEECFAWLAGKDIE